MMRRLIVTTQFVLMASIIFGLSIASGEIIQLTENDYDDTRPLIHSGQVVWAGDNIRKEIYYWDGNSVQQLNNDDIGYGVAGGYDIHNGHVVWTGYGNHPSLAWLYYWDGISVKPIAAYQIGYNPIMDPKIHNGMVVWETTNGTYIGTWGLNLSEPCTEFSIDRYICYGPQVHNGQVVYAYGSFTSSETDIYFWDETSCHRIPNNSYDYNIEPQIHNGQVVWTGGHCPDCEVFYWNGTSVQQLTDNSYDDIHPQIHNGQVVWYGWDGNDYEIFLWKENGVQQLTDNDYQDYEPQIHDGQVTWTIDDAARNSAQIVYWDGTSVEQLTYDNDTQNRVPQIHNGQVVWQSDDGTDSEIFFWSGIKKLLKFQPFIPLLLLSD